MCGKENLTLIFEWAKPRPKYIKPIDRLIGIGFAEEQAIGICNRWICDLDILDEYVEKIENQKALFLTDEQVKVMKDFILSVAKWHPKKRGDCGGIIV
jgi:hypothetical protein